MPVATTFQPDKRYSIERVQLLALGTVTDMNGRKAEIDDSFCEEVVKSYNPLPGGHEALISLDHERRGPAFGRVPAIYHEPGVGVFADYADVPGDKAREFVRGGAFPNRSVEVISLSGRRYLGTVSHLGAQRPAIKGMAPIYAHQVREQDGESTELGEVESGGVWLFSEPAQEEQMGNDETLKLAEEKHALELALAESKREKEALAAQLKDKEEREAVLLAEQKFSEAEGQALQFAESIKGQTGVVPATEVAAVIAHASVNCPAIKGQNFGECLKGIFSKLPKMPPTGELNLGEKSDNDDEQEFKTGKQARAYLEAKRPSTLKLAEGFVGTQDEQDKYLIKLAENVRDEEGSR